MRLIAFISILLALASCKIYNQNILFRTKTDIIPENAKLLIAQAEKNYRIQKNDIIEFNIFTDKGEIIIAPPGTIKQNANNLQNMQGGMIGGGMMPGGMMPGMMGGGLMPGGIIPGAMQQLAPLSIPYFLVRADGFARLPRIGEVYMEGLTLQEADSLLEKRYSDLYENVFIRTRYNNKRVVLLKGDIGTIVPLFNEKVTLVEVLAQTGGVQAQVRAKNIRLIRGDLENPTVYVIDLSTIEGMKRINLTLEPNDIIYIEPTRRFILDSFREITTIVTIITNAIVLILAIQRNP